MKTIIPFIILVLLAVPCLASPFDGSGHQYVMVAAQADKKKDKNGDHSGGKVVITGKGGKVTGVDKKPKKK